MVCLTVITGSFLFLALSTSPKTSSMASSSSLYLLGMLLIKSLLWTYFINFFLNTKGSKSFDADLKKKEDQAEKVSGKPNFVFIVADDLGWNSIGYQDYDLTFASPFITSLARKGVIMSNYYGQEICTPSRASLLTGRYPLSIGENIIRL